MIYQRQSQANKLFVETVEGGDPEEGGDVVREKELPSELHDMD